jgi:hypothetical protein
MTYDTPELRALTPAINAIQAAGTSKIPFSPEDSQDQSNEVVSSYADWE